MTQPMAGHGLRFAGAPHNAAGHRISLYGPATGDGRAKCTCGWLSGVLPTAAARKHAHAEHKRQVQAARAQGNA